jgi:hypothetical protein
VRRLGEAQRRALEDDPPLADQPALGRRVLLQHDAGEAVPSRAMVPELVHEVLPSVVVVEKRGIEPAAVEEDGIRPVAVDAGAGDEVVVEVAQRGPGGAADRGATVALDVRVDEVEKAVRVGEAGRPHTAGVRVAAHVELARARQGPGQETPVQQVARVVDLDSGEPLEGRGGDVVVVADAHDRRDPG